MTSECCVCYETYNKTNRAKVICPGSNCDLECCKACVRRYLITTTKDPHCMSCGIAWSQKFMIESLNRSYVSKEYRTHRSKLLVERQIAQLPESMEAASNERKARDLDKYSDNKMNEINELQLKLRKLQRDRLDASQKAWRLRNPEAEEKTAAAFIMPCPHGDCRGFLSSQYKCGICNMHTCSRCFEVIGENKNDPHECNPDNVATAEELKKNTKPCPKCGTRISKISGCDQMWCVHCKTPFSWRTGAIETGVVHNPHFYEYQRNVERNGGAAGAENQALTMCNMNGIPGWWQFRSQFRNIRNRRIREELTKIYRATAHNSRVCVGNYNTTINRLINTKNIRIKYILNEITKKEMSNTLYKNDKMRNRTTQMLHVMEVAVAVGRDIIIGIVNHPNITEDMVLGEIEKYKNVCLYCNEQYEILGNTHKIMMPYLTIENTINKRYH